MKNIVILGGSYAGISTAHRILKQAPKDRSFKITLVSPNTHFYWNMASPRGMIPGQFSDEQLFKRIADGFHKYTVNQFEFILASAESIDFEAKKVEIVGSSGTRTLSYDFLIVATGTRTKTDTPFKSLGSTEETKDLLHEFQKKIQDAKTIVVAGAGVTGVEAAGELGFEYGRQKKIILIATASTTLDGAPPSVSNIATKALQNLNVQIRFRTKVVESKQLPGGQQELTLSSGGTIITDMYIPTFGLVPNSSFVAARFLDTNGYVTVDDHLNIKGVKEAWAVGDVSDVEYSQFISCDRQSVYAAKSVVSLLNGKPPVPYKAITSRFMGLQIGKKAATGHWGNMKIPSFVIVFARKNLFTQNLVPTVDGSLF